MPPINHLASSHAPKVTIITAVYNGAGVIDRCIASVAAQQYSNLEHIVIDGGSTDGTVDIIRRNEAGLSGWVSEPDNGVYDAWNKGLSMSHGEWIAFLGADDVYLPGAIQKYIDTAERNIEADYISSRVEFVYRSGATRIIGQPWTWANYRNHMCVAHVGSFHRKALFESLGTFDQSYRIVGDYELLLRAKGRLRAAFLDAVTARMDAGGQSDSSATLKETRLAKLHHGAASQLGAGVDYVLALAKYHFRTQLRRAFFE